MVTFSQAAALSVQRSGELIWVMMLEYDSAQSHLLLRNVSGHHYDGSFLYFNIFVEVSAC